MGTSRRAAPLGDPRGIPKLSRKFSLRKGYLRIGERAITSVHHLKFEGSVNIFVASTSATRKFFQVNIDFAKMSVFEGMDFPLSSFFDGLLEEIGDTMEFVSDDGRLPILSEEELDFNIDMLDVVPEVVTPPTDRNSAVLPAPTEAEDQATIVINIQNDLDLVWNPVELGPSQPAARLSKDQTEREKNNEASRSYRQRKKAKLAAQEDIVKELKSKVVSLLANEREGGVKRNHEADT